MEKNNEDTLRWLNGEKKSKDRLEFEKGIIDADNDLKEAAKKQAQPPVTNSNNFHATFILRVTNMSEESKEVVLFDTDYHNAMIEISSIFKTLSYHEIMRLMPHKTLEVSFIHVEKISPASVNIKNLKFEFITKDLDGSSFTFPFTHREDSHAVQLSVALYYPSYGISYKIDTGLTYLKLLMPAKTNIQIHIQSLVNSGFLNK